VPVLYTLVSSAMQLGGKAEARMRCKRLLTVLATFGLAGSAAADQVDIGVLTCTMAEGGDAPAANATAAASERDIVCSFQLKNGGDETYVGRVQGVSLSGDGKAALLWTVSGAVATQSGPGLLQQTYAADPAAPKDQTPALIGDLNSEIILQSMADKKEGESSQSEKSPASGFVVIRVELKLKATAG